MYLQQERVSISLIDQLSDAMGQGQPTKVYQDYRELLFMFRQDFIYMGKSFQFLASNSFVNITLIIPHSTSEEAVSVYSPPAPPR